MEDSDFLEGMIQEAAKGTDENKEEYSWLFCPCEWVGAEAQNVDNEMKAMVNNMRHVFTEGTPMNIHHQMAVVYAN